MRRTTPRPAPRDSLSIRKPERILKILLHQNIERGVGSSAEGRGGYVGDFCVFMQFVNSEEGYRAEHHPLTLLINQQVAYLPPPHLGPHHHPANMQVDVRSDGALSVPAPAGHGWSPGDLPDHDQIEAMSYEELLRLAGIAGVDAC